ncbi:hypothetical protein GCM10023220_00870 [Streptomyces ziwulingensis]|uniref:Uncharacterized protein n=1 Tax=Streptomyces ziwulingensis TaxID=1045501 RepID=A0ABP9AJ74_9ACTN
MEARTGSVALAVAAGAQADGLVTAAATAVVRTTRERIRGCTKEDSLSGVVQGSAG